MHPPSPWCDVAARAHPPGKREEGRPAAAARARRTYRAGRAFCCRAHGVTRGAPRAIGAAAPPCRPDRPQPPRSPLGASPPRELTRWGPHARRTGGVRGVLSPSPPIPPPIPRSTPPHRDEPQEARPHCAAQVPPTLLRSVGGHPESSPRGGGAPPPLLRRRHAPSPPLPPSCTANA